MSSTSEPADFFKFQLKQDSDKFVICHPSPMTKGANLLLELENEDKNWLIPVDKEFLVSKVPYFEALFNTEGFWKETKNTEKIEGVSKVQVDKLDNVSNKTVWKFLEMLHARSMYDRYDSKFKTDNFINTHNVLEFLVLSDIWMVEDIKTEAVKYVDEIRRGGNHFPGDVMMAAYKHNNPFVRKTIEPMFQSFVKRKEFLEPKFESMGKRIEYLEPEVKSLNLKVESLEEEKSGHRAKILKVWVRLDSTIQNQPKTDDKLEVKRYFEQVKVELSNLKDKLNDFFGTYYVHHSGRGWNAPSYTTNAYFFK